MGLQTGGSSNTTTVGKYELGCTLGEGTFAKVKFAKNVKTGECVAIKIIDKEKIKKHKMIQQIKREISTMKLIKHPNVVQLKEVMATKKTIYIVLELVIGGELVDKIVDNQKMKEHEARRYFHQLINAIDFCHSREVFHRDLKPENLLLDSQGNLKVSDFGLGALPQQVREDGLLHTTCGTPNYVAPEVISGKGYRGAPADLWSCGVILYLLMAGYLPFEDPNLPNLYKKIKNADFTCPPWFSQGARRIVRRILDPNPETRITIPEIFKDEWFRRGYRPVTFVEDEAMPLEDFDAIFSDSTEYNVDEEREVKPFMMMNAFELISMSEGLNLSNLFQNQQDLNMKRQLRFTSKHPAKEIITKIEGVAKHLGFKVQKSRHKMRLQDERRGRKGHLSVATQIFEVASSFVMVEMSKACGDTIEFHKFYKSLTLGIKDIIWSSGLHVEEIDNKKVK